MLEVRNLTVKFGSVIALCIEKFNVADKELRVVIGPNGAGKSTLMDVLCGKTTPDDGSAIFNGTQLIGKSEIEINRLGVGRKFQKPTIFDGLTVFDNMVLGLKGNRSVIYSLFFKLSSTERDKIHSVAAQVNLTNEMLTMAGALSHGQKQWLEIAIVLLQEPELLLIDEPAAGMSDSETAKTGELLIELGKTRSVIVIEHDMHFVEQIAQNLVTVLVRGSVLTQACFADVKNNQKVIDCYLGSPDSAQNKQ